MRTALIILAIVLCSIGCHDKRTSKVADPAPVSRQDSDSISDLQMRLDRLRVGMTEAETKRIVALQHRARFVHAGCSHSWANTYAPDGGYFLALSFTGERGFVGARLRDKSGLEKIWPR